MKCINKNMFDNSNWSFVTLKRSVGFFPRAVRICSEMIKSTEFVLHESFKVSTHCPVVREA